MTIAARTLAPLFTALVAGLLAWLPATPAHGQRTAFVSATGNDGNSCDITAPCATISTAITRVTGRYITGGGSGIVRCLDGNDYRESNPIVIEIGKVEIDCRATKPAAGPFIVNGVSAIIRGVTIFMKDGVDGINVNSGGELVVSDTTIEDSIGGFAGIRFAGARLVVTDTTIRMYGQNSTDGGGIIVQPADVPSRSSFVAMVTLDGVDVSQNTTGLFFYARPTRQIHALIKNSTVSGNTFTGIYVLSNGGLITATIERSTIAHNGGTGVLAQGDNAFVSVTGSTITGNNTGWTFLAGGNLITYLDNKVSMNLASDGAPSASLGPQ
jgi:hypothetical protein